MSRPVYLPESQDIRLPMKRPVYRRWPFSATCTSRRRTAFKPWGLSPISAPKQRTICGLSRMMLSTPDTTKIIDAWPRCLCLQPKSVRFAWSAWTTGAVLPVKSSRASDPVLRPEALSGFWSIKDICACLFHLLTKLCPKAPESSPPQAGNSTLKQP